MVCVSSPQRIAVHELSDRAHVIAHDLQNLAPGDGVKLLQSLGVNGNNKELEKTVREYGCHALALSLLGNVLRLRHKGDVLKRDTLKDLVKPDGNQVSRHAFKVMQAYEEWFAGEPELALLHLLGLFDHPIGQEVLQVLWDEQIPNLTAGISEDDWLEVITTLCEEHHLLSRHEETDDAPDGQLDCHPLIREYFGRQLREKQPDAWRQAHTRLYEYYKTLPKKEFPDTLEEMRPLFNAVAHGCAAGLYQKALDEVYSLHIRRGNENYVCHKLGAYSDDLAVVANFFTIPWHTPVESLTKNQQAAILNQAGYRLRAMGRLREALEPMQAGTEIRVGLEDWKNASRGANNLSQLQLTLGDVKTAVANSWQSVCYADRSGDMSRRIISRTICADALHQVGETPMALALFIEVERIQQEFQSEYLDLYSLPSFQYCDFLLAQGRTEEALEREADALGWAKKGGESLLAIALNQLIIGRVHWQRGIFLEATHWLDQAVASLRAAGDQDMLPLGFLARAALQGDTSNPNHEFIRAHQDLQEVHDIAEPSGMRLHLTDYHLEMARLLIAEKGNPPQSPFFKGGSPGSDVVVIPPLEKGGPGGISVQEHVAKAEKLIEETGYKRRLPELQELQQIIREQPFS
jgi:tetratricopeptide (TPR) repeat protein